MALLDRSYPWSQPKAPGSLRAGRVLLAAAAAIVVIALVRVVQTSQATTASFAIQGLEQERVELAAEVRQLEADVAGLSSLARIEQEARRLGLQPPKGRDSVEVNAAWPGAGDERLPTRFRPVEQREPGASERDASWWRDLLALLPFD